MPRLSSWFVRASLVYLALGFTLGALLLTNKGLDFSPWLWKLLPIHIEILIMGWFVQLAVGVAFWILPRLSGASPRGNERLVWLAFWLINIGIGVVVLEALTSLPWLLLIGRLVEFGGVIAFVIGLWKRVKAFGRKKNS
jgi:heme/copper-type cytochrome/quinol oxidase subunit 1